MDYQASRGFVVDMTYRPWFYLVAFAFWVGLGVLIGLRARRPARVMGWSIGFGAFATLGTTLQSGTFSPVEALIDLIEVTVMIAGPAFAIRAIVTRLRPPNNASLESPPLPRR
jgi:hypothetical protein